MQLGEWDLGEGLLLAIQEQPEGDGSEGLHGQECS